MTKNQNNKFYENFITKNDINNLINNSRDFIFFKEEISEQILIINEEINKPKIKELLNKEEFKQGKK